MNMGHVSLGGSFEGEKCVYIDKYHGWKAL